MFLIILDFAYLLFICMLKVKNDTRIPRQYDNL